VFNSPFENKNQDNGETYKDSQVVFVSDMFVQQYVGGAELTAEALINTCPVPFARVKSSEVTMDLLSKGSEKHWVFFNFAGMDFNLIPTIITNINYSIVEFDYKFCRYRSTEKHEVAEGKPCDCHEEMSGKIVSAFFHGASSLWWMSENQKKFYEDRFPFLNRQTSTVLSSVFDDDFFIKIAQLRQGENFNTSSKMLIVGSDSWIKGVENSKGYCDQNEIDYEIVNNLSYSELLSKLSESKGLVFLPNGKDTCPRLVIEAKLLDCELVLNENVQHLNEEWFDTDDLKTVADYLFNRRNFFWSKITDIIDRLPTISGYTTTLNCIDQNYPFEESIESLLRFCDQVVVVDGGSTDGTWEKLENISKKNEKLIIHKQERDWSSKRFAVFDGLQKALARAICTGEFCWQQDSDEIVHKNDVEKIKTLVKNLPKSIDLLALPVIEYWGKNQKVRLDVNPWKWRLSRNRPHITHGIPASLRLYDDDGNLYSKPGSDGCDYIRSDTYEVIPCATFYDESAHNLRMTALTNDSKSIENYTKWFETVIDSLPAVFHYSWFDISRKIRTYRDYWSKHWQSLYNVIQDDTPENNMFFDKKWEDVSEQEIESLSKKLENELGGWIFHSKVSFENKTPHIEISKDQPDDIKAWINK
jgi:glycosyltransferase involved in cell wall biosynthesis